MGKTNIESDSVIEGIGRERGGDTDTTGSSSGSVGISGSAGGKSTASRGEEKPVEVVVLTQDSKGKTEAKNKQPKPKQVKKQKETSIKAEDVQAFVKALFATIASFPNMGHWNISDGEAKALSEPLSHILSDMLKTELPNAHYVGLAIGLVSITVPRLFITIQLRKVQVNEQTRKVKERDQGGQQTAASPDTERNAGLYASLPATS